MSMKLIRISTLFNKLLVIKGAQKNWLRNFLIICGLTSTWAIVAFILPLDPPNALRIEATPIYKNTHLSFEKVHELPDSHWKPISGRELRAMGAEEFDVWIRVHVPSQLAPESYYFQVEYSLLQQVNFYLVEQGKIIDRFFTGWSHDKNQDLSPGQHYIFNFASSTDYNRIVYLNARSPSFITVPLLVQNERDFIKIAGLRFAFVWLLLGLFLGIAIYNIVYGSMLRDQTFLYYLLSQFFITITLIAFYTPAFRWVPYFRDHATSVGYLIIFSLVFSGIFLCLFIRGYLDMGKNFPNTQILNKLVVIAMFFSLGFFAVLPLHTGLVYVLSFALILAFVVPLYFIFIAGVDAVFILLVALSGLVTLGGAALLSIGNVTPGNFFADHLPLLGLLWTSSTLSLGQAYNMRRFQKERGQIINALAADAPTQVLNGILNSTFSDGLKSSEREISIMFVDIVAFSQMTEIYGHQRIFSVISKILEQISSIVVQHGGFVDRSLGDGILCFFGYSNHQASKEHVRNAFDAAKRIQELTCRQIETLPLEDKFDLPLRIGLNTSKVLIGNVGGEDRVDFTLIGTGVNLASRLETACSPYKIMVSQDFKKLLHLTPKEKLAFNKIYVPIKHFKELLTAFEYDPWHERPDIVSKAYLAFRQHLGATPKKRRLIVDVAHHIWLDSSFGRFDIVDVSLGGVKLVAQSYLGKHCKVLFQVQSTSPTTMNQVKDKMLHSFYAEVKWSNPVGSLRYLHGLEFIGLNDDQKQFLLDMVLEGRIMPKFLATI